MGAPRMVTSLMSGRATFLSMTDPNVILDAFVSRRPRGKGVSEVHSLEHLVCARPLLRIACSMELQDPRCHCTSHVLDWNLPTSSPSRRWQAAAAALRGED